MRRYLWIAEGFAIIIGCYFLINNYIDGKKQEHTIMQSTKTTVEHVSQDAPVTVVPVAHASVVLRWGDTVFYADPVGGGDQFLGNPHPNIILVTDIHGDHFSADTLAAIIGSAVLLVPQSVKELLPEPLFSSARVLKNGETITEQGFKISALPMYNLPEFADSRHPKGRGNGYVIERGDYRVYIAGDTSGTPEIRALSDIDIAFVPMNLPYTMGVEEAADAVLSFKPKHVYPYHYREPDGLADVVRFKELVNAGNSSIDVVLADWYPLR